MRIWVLLLAVSLNAGCIGSLLENQHESEMGLYLRLDSSYTMVEREVAYDQVPIGWSMGDYYLGSRPPTWHSLPAERDMLIVNGTVLLSFTVEEVATTLAARPELTAWFGVEDRYGAHLFFDGPAVIQEGDSTMVADDLPLPPGGLLLREGERLSLRVASYMSDAQGLGNVELIVGGADFASDLFLRAQPTHVPAYDEALVVRAQDQLQGTRCGVADPTDTATATYEINVPEDAMGLRVNLLRLAGAGPPDLDFIIYNELGDSVWGGEASGGNEAAVLGPANLDAAGRGLWTIYVFSCQPQVVEFQLDAWLWYPEPQ